MLLANGNEDTITSVITAFSGLILAATGLFAVLWRKLNRVQWDVAKSVNGIVDQRVTAAEDKGRAEGIIKGMEKSWREGGTSKKVLIVDDDKIVLELYRILLESAGYLIFTARTGLQAVQKTQVAHPDLIILDWLLPDVSGRDVLSWLIEVTNAPIMVVSGNLNQLPQDRLQKQNIESLEKPVEPKYLLERVANKFSTRDPKK